MLSVFGNSFDESDLDAMRPVLQSHLVGMGEITQQFEREFATEIGFPHPLYGVATNSCTNSFWLIGKALNFSKFDQIIIPNIHFFGIKNVLNLLNVEPTVVDVSEGIPNVTLANIKDKITPYTKAIIFLEYGGYPVNIKEIKEYLVKIKRTDINLILDAANSPFTKHNNIYSAINYDIAVYSFDLNKLLVTGDGGMILVKDPSLARRLKSWSYYGIADLHKSGFEKSKEKDIWWEVDIDTPSLKLPMNNLTAALGLSQLKKMDAILGRRQEILNYYLSNLKSFAQFTLPPQDELVKNNLYLFWIRLADSTVRNRLAKFLLSKDIYTTVKYQPLDSQAETPNAFKFYQTSLCLPFNQNLTLENLDYIVQQIKIFFDE